MKTINSHSPIFRQGTARISISTSEPESMVAYLFGGNSYVYQPGTTHPGDTHQTPDGEYPFGLYDVDPPDPSDEDRFVAYRIPINRNITISGSTRHTEKRVIEYRWDLGDGTIKYGPTIRHRYISLSPEVCLRLSITFEDGSSIRSNENLILYKPLTPDTGMYPDTGTYPDTGVYPR